MNVSKGDWERRLGYFKGGGIDLLPPASEEALIEAETRLNCSLSPQHKDFLRRYNGGRILEIHLFGIPMPGSRRGIPNRVDIVARNIDFLSEEWWPRAWRRIGNDGFGNYYVTDLSRRSMIGEYPVLLVDHETLGSDFADISSVDFATDYFGFLEKILEDMIQLYTPEGKLKNLPKW